MMMVKNSSLFMGMTKMKVMALMALLFSFGAGAQEYTWEAVPIDGSMTGCRTAGVKDVPEALGRIDDSGTYISPSGRVFPATSSTAGVAALLIDAQSYMSDVKQVIGHSAAEMPNARYETQLSNWFVSILKDPMLINACGRLERVMRILCKDVEMIALCSRPSACIHVKNLRK